MIEHRLSRWQSPQVSRKVDAEGQAVLRFAGGDMTMSVRLAQGGKITQLQVAGQERLLAADPWPQPPTQTSDFTESPVGGWDEMAPTISSCTLDGLTYPDHGDAWRGVWQETGPHEHRYLSGSFNYSLTRQIRTDGVSLRIDYSLHSFVDQHLMWAAHPLFVVAPGSFVTLPFGVATMQDISKSRPQRVEWDCGRAGIDHVPAGQYRKYVTNIEDTVAWAQINGPDGTWTRLAWSTELLPYFALYFDQQAFAAAPCIALEPMTGWYDSLERAVSNGTANGVAAGTTRRWWLQVSAGNDWTADNESFLAAHGLRQ